jgi:glycosyltransferase involved in cell wall biosynthesis
MRAGLIWAAEPRLVDISVRFERYVRGLQAAGCEVLTVCRPVAAPGYPYPLHTADLDEFRSPTFWKAVDLDVAILITWLALPDIVSAIKESGAYVVSLADSDGQIGARVHPRPLLRRMVAMHRAWDTKLRAAKHFVQLYLYGAPSRDRPVLDSATAADLVAVCSPRARDHLRQFFRHYRRPDLADKVVAVPYPVDDCYLRGDVPSRRANRAVAIGRWDDPQKDAPRLCRAVADFYRSGGTTEVAIVGAGGGRWLEPLCRRFPLARRLGVQPPDAIAHLLRHNRSLLLSSRWESGPIVLNEALACGCTVVGTDSVPSVLSACDEGPFGTVSAGRSAARLADALRVEMALWDAGRRDPAAIAAHWRPRFDPVAVCRQLLSSAPAVTRP